MNHEYRIRTEASTSSECATSHAHQTHNSRFTYSSGKSFFQNFPSCNCRNDFFFISNIKIITRVRFPIQNFQTSLKFVILNPCSMFYDLYHSVELEIENLLYMRRNGTQKLFHIFSTLSSITQLGCRFGNSQNMANSCMADSSKE